MKSLSFDLRVRLIASSVIGAIVYFFFKLSQVGKVIIKKDHRIYLYIGNKRMIYLSIYLHVNFRIECVTFKN